EVKRRVLAGMVPKVTVGWRPRCACFPDPCDRCRVPWEHRKVLQRVSTFNVRVRDAKKGILGQKSGLGGENADATEEEIEDYGEEKYKVAEADVSWPGCGCRALVPAVVLDPFAGSGTTLVVARQLYRRGAGIELSPLYVDMCRRRVAEETAGLAPRFVPQRRLTEFVGST
ncbi:MAG: DNA methyltransferase, partial [Thermoplasmata archaeon]